MKKTYRLLIIILFFGLFFSFGNHKIFADSGSLRVVSLAPSTTEILFALGLDQEIVGVSSFCDYPAQAKTKDKVGSFSRPNIERVLSLKPDLVFCTGLEQAPAVRGLKQLGLEVYVSDPASMEELFLSIREIAGLTAKEKQAQALIKEMKRKIERITFRTKEVPEKNRPKVFVEYWNNPLMTAGPGSFIDELIWLAGGINIAANLKRPYSYFSPEEVIASNPDCIILAYMVNEEPVGALEKRFAWREISAVKNRRVYNDIDPSLLLRPGPRIVDGLTQMYKKLYPENE